MYWKQICIAIALITGLNACSNNDNHNSDSNNANDDNQEFVPIRSVPAFVPIDFKLLEKDNPIIPDNAMVKALFDQLKNDNYLQKELRDSSFAIQQLNYPIVFGKLNNDNAIDVLIPITFRKPNLEDKSKKHPFYFENYYIVALNNGKELIPAELFYSGNDEAELLIQFRSISDSGLVKGKQVPNTFNKYPDEFDIKYSLQNGEMKAVL